VCPLNNVSDDNIAKKGRFLNTAYMTGKNKARWLFNGQKAIENSTNAEGAVFNANSPACAKGI
jgi:hypothetical protein